MPSLSEFSEAPGSTWIIVRVSAKVLTQVKLFVSGRLETEKSIYRDNKRGKKEQKIKAGVLEQVGKECFRSRIGHNWSFGTLIE